MRIRDDTNLMLMIACLVVDVILGVTAGAVGPGAASLVLVGAAAVLSMSVMYFVRPGP
ncbi:hypothetical protein [Ferrimicrobium sp.]|uniref:hypothetical protein n=1 Tax=Ferrimicrobium sp. TaxID=2926050 RepID=UPI00261A9F07|nr:hypothetical protein [Ferrimicrobium sp.]